MITINSACREKENICATVSCIAQVSLKIKFLDANNKDLLFSSNPAYSVNDLKIHSSRHFYEVPFQIDSTNKNNKIIIVNSTASQRLLFKLGNKPPDVIDMETSLKEGGCCGRLEIADLKVNQSPMCTGCSDINPIILIK